MLDENGIWLTSDADIDYHLFSYFSTIFKSDQARDLDSPLSVVGLLVTENMNRMLTKPVTNSEIKVAAFQLGSLKAPKPDGYSGIFYHKYWDVVGANVCEAIKIFFTTGHLPQEWNHTNLVLIPKVQNPETLSQY